MNNNKKIVEINEANSEKHLSALKVIGIILLILLSLGLAKELLKDIK